VTSSLTVLGTAVAVLTCARVAQVASLGCHFVGKGDTVAPPFFCREVGPMLIKINNNDDDEDEDEDEDEEDDTD